MSAPPPRTSRRRLLDALPHPGWRGPVLLRAVDAALAASVAWLLVQPFGGLSDRYPYLAPLGAVITVSESVAASAREGAAVIRNLVLGALLGTAVLQADLSMTLSLAVVIGIGTLLQGFRPVARGSSWISYSAVFVLVVGSEDPLGYGLAYAGLTSLGALVALGVMTALPPVLVGSGSQVIAEAGDVLGGQLDDLAEGLAHDEALTEDEWLPRRHALAPEWRHLSDTVQAAALARRGNWRAAWWSSRAEQQERLAHLVEGTFPLVQHLVLLLTHDERADRTSLALGPELRPVTATVLRAWADLVREATRGDDLGEAAAHLSSCLDQLAERLRTARRSTDADTFTAGAVVSTVRRGLDLLTGAA